MDKGQHRRNLRLWHCLETVCAMEPRLEEMGQAELFRRDFRFLRRCLACSKGMNCGEGDLQRMERAIQELLLELRELFASVDLQNSVCMGRY